MSRIAPLILAVLILAPTPAAGLELNGNGCIVTNTTATTQLDQTGTAASGVADMDGDGEEDAHIFTQITGATPVGNHGVQQLTLSHQFDFFDDGTVTTQDRAVAWVTASTMEVRTQSDVVSGGSGHLTYKTSVDLASGVVTTQMHGVLCLGNA